MDLEVHACPASHHYWELQCLPSVPLIDGHMSSPPVTRQQVDASQIPFHRPPVALPRPPVAVLVNARTKCTCCRSLPHRATVGRWCC